MQRFFINNPITTGSYSITGDTASHISRSLRMRPGEMLVLCHAQVDYICEIATVGRFDVTVNVLNSAPCAAEPAVDLTLLQCLPKGDKMDLIVQKAVEVGVSRVVPVISARCVSRPSAASLAKKVPRWQKIALEAAQQSGRGIVPAVLSAAPLSDAVQAANAHEAQLIAFYENSTAPLIHFAPKSRSVAVLVGPEGGLDPSEVRLIEDFGGSIRSLGRRILRTETAAIVACALLTLSADARSCSEA